MRILFITTSNLSSNPRLVKEIRLALSKKYKIVVVLFDLKQWTTELEKLYQKEFKDVELIYLPVSRQNLISWLQLSIVHIAAKKFYRYFPLSLKLAAVASNKRSFSLVKKLKNLCCNIDLIVAHNLGALYPAFQISKKLKVPFAFDVEDYHPGEVIKVDTANEVERRRYLMQKLFLKANYVTAASPLIAEEVEKLCKVPVTTVNNSFYSSEFSLVSSTFSKKRVNLVWFSQNINQGRGLELLLPALDHFSDKVNLTLIGHLNPEFAKAYLTGRNYVVIKAPLSQMDLHQELSNYDIGLALELEAADFNRNIALTNKIFAYKQAGLYILATDTKAQLAFMERYKDDGAVTEQTVGALKRTVGFIIENIESIRASKLNRFEQAKEIAFETEAQKLVALWERAFQK